MQPLTDSYLVEIARQMAFLGAFLGGFAATFLATLLVVDSAKRIAGWVVDWNGPGCRRVGVWLRGYRLAGQHRAEWVGALPTLGNRDVLRGIRQPGSGVLGYRWVSLSCSTAYDRYRSEWTCAVNTM